MPGTPSPVGNRGPLGAWWAAILGGLESQSQRIGALEAGATQGNIVDGSGNTLEIAGTNLAQTVVIGANLYATPATAGVQVGTGLTGAGRAKQANLATGTVTTTKGSTTATLVSTASGTFTNGQVIGAANVSDPSSGIATPAIVPGTTFTISGATITLSQAAAESGTAIYAAACNFTRL